MKISLALVIISLAWILKPSDSYSQYLKCSKEPVHIHYLNGMFNSFDDALRSKDEIQKIFTAAENWKKTTWYDRPTVSFTHNRSYLREAGYSDENKFEDAKSSLLAMMDFLEVAEQKLQNYAEAYGIEGIYTWEEIAASYYGLKFANKHPAAKLTLEAIAYLMKSQMTYKAEDAQRMVDNLRPYRDAKDKVIIVSHSQGNLHANETFLRLFPDFQADYPFQRPLDIQNSALIGNLWGNFQVTSPATIITNPRHKTMRFAQDTVFGADVGQPRNFMLEVLPDGLPETGQSERAPDNDPKAHTFLLYTSRNYKSALACAEGPCPDTTKTNREHFIDRMQEVAEMLPSNCGEITADEAFSIDENSLSKVSKSFVKNYSKLNFNPNMISYGNTISGLDESQKDLLVSSYVFNGGVASNCINVDDNPYFCDSPISRSIASVTLDRVDRNPVLNVTNTFNESFQLYARDYLPSNFQVFNGNEPIFAPSLDVAMASSVSLTMGMEGANIEVDLSSTDNEFEGNVPDVYWAFSLGDHASSPLGSGQVTTSITIAQKPNAPSEDLYFYFASEGLFGAKKFVEKKVTVNYCKRDNCCVDQGEGLTLGKYIWSDTYNDCRLKAPENEFMDYRCNVRQAGIDPYGYPFYHWNIQQVYNPAYEYFVPYVFDYMGMDFIWGGSIRTSEGNANGSFSRDIHVRYSIPATGEDVSYWRTVTCSW